MLVWGLFWQGWSGGMTLWPCCGRARGSGAVSGSGVTGAGLAAAFSGQAHLACLPGIVDHMDHAVYAQVATMVRGDEREKKGGALLPSATNRTVQVPAGWARHQQASAWPSMP